MTSAKNDIDNYISQFPSETQDILERIRNEIKKLAPNVEEKISYAIPGFTVNGKYLIYFAGYKKHIGIYPAPVAIDAFKEDFKNYKTGKGSVQFPLGEPIPFDLIRRIIKFRIENIKAQK